MSVDQLPALAWCNVHGGVRLEDDSQCATRRCHSRDYVECEFVAYTPSDRAVLPVTLGSAHPGEDTSPVDLPGETSRAIAQEMRAIAEHIAERDLRDRVLVLADAVGQL